MECYEWLILYLVQEMDKRQNEVISTGADKFTARNESQVYRAGLLSRAYGEYTALRYFWSQVAAADPSLQAMLNNVGCLYGLSCLDKHLVYFYPGGFAAGPELSQNVKDTILALCKDLKSDSLAITDGLAPPDYVINSVLGRSDGKLYENIEKTLIHNPSAMSRPNWWYEILGSLKFYQTSKQTLKFCLNSKKKKITTG